MDKNCFSAIENMETVAGSWAERTHWHYTSPFKLHANPCPLALKIDDCTSDTHALQMEIMSATNIPPNVRPFRRAPKLYLRTKDVHVQMEVVSVVSSPKFGLISSDDLVLVGRRTCLPVFDPLSPLTWAVIGITAMTISAVFAGLDWKNFSTFLVAVFQDECYWTNQISRLCLARAACPLGSR